MRKSQLSRLRVVEVKRIKWTRPRDADWGPSETLMAKSRFMIDRVFHPEQMVVSAWNDARTPCQEELARVQGEANSNSLHELVDRLEILLTKLFIRPFSL